MARRSIPWLLACLAVLPDVSLGAQDQKPVPGSDSYDELYRRYLASARSISTSVTPSVSWMAGLVLDPRAHAVNDLVTIRVVENIVGAGTADSALSKESKAKAGVAQLMGAESFFPDWLDEANIVGAAANTDFKGGGTTSRTGEITATVTARVVEVLPNGDLVLEGAREIDINGDRQIIVLTGVVRQADIERNNVVPSTRIGQFRIRYFGRGLIKDNLRPGWLIRVLNIVF
jgi:flagellar L-ring protein precursor FlgH